MGRKSKDVTIEAEGRDKDKVFRLTEMPASQGEEWAFRALTALAKSNVDIPDDVMNLGMAGIATFGFSALAGIEFRDLKPLLEEMMACVQAVPSPNVVRKLIEEDIEEVPTRLFLRKEVFELHTGFFELAAKSRGSTSKTADAAAS